MSYKFGQVLYERICRELGKFERRGIEDDGLRRAAVAIVVVPGEDVESACVLLTLRPKTLKRHGNQYALPGGRLDPGESAVEGALRELEEELGLPRTEADVIGKLDDFPTRSGFSITPVVVWGGEAPRLRPDPNEVAEVFRIPLAELDLPEIPHLDHLKGREHPVMSAPLPTLGHHLYAPTAALLYQFREVVLRGRATRVAHFDQPKFAWK